MEYIYLLKQRRLAILWLSQVLSAMGDQLYVIAAMWMAVQSFGSRAAFVAAAIFIARICFGLVGGVCADRFNRQSVMVGADIIRFLVVLTLPIFAHFGAINFWHLIVVSVAIGMFGALFDPALQSTLPALAQSPRALLSMNGLMDVTQRLARAIGPGCAGFLAMTLPLEHFFTIDAVSFFISAGAIAALGKHINWHANSMEKHDGVFRDFKEAFRLVITDKLSRWGFLSIAFIDGFWSCAFTAGIPLWVKLMPNASVSEYGLIVSFYGIGNVVTNVIVGAIPLRRIALAINIGYLLLGSGFVILSQSRDLVGALLGIVIASIGGPLGSLPFLTILQTKLPSQHLGKILSLRMVLSSAGIAAGLMCAAPLYAHLNVAVVIAVCGLLMFATGLLGMCLFGFSNEARHIETFAKESVVSGAK